MKLVQKGRCLEKYKTQFDVIVEEETYGKYDVKQYELPDWEDEENEFLVYFLSLITNHRDYEEEMKFIYKYITGINLGQNEQLCIEFYKEFTDNDRLYFELETDMTDDQLFLIYSNYKEKILKKELTFK